jgi:translation initiation factor IF-2
VRDLAEKMETSPIEVIKVLMANGVMASINQNVDFDTAAVVASELGLNLSWSKLKKRNRKMPVKSHYGGE